MPLNSEKRPIYRFLIAFNSHRAWLFTIDLRNERVDNLFELLFLFLLLLKLYSVVGIWVDLRIFLFLFLFDAKR